MLFGKVALAAAPWGQVVSPAHGRGEVGAVTLYESEQAGKD